MKKSFVQIFWGGLIVLFCVVGAAAFVAADQLQQARVSQVIQDVRVLETHGAPRPAAVNDKVTQRNGSTHRRRVSRGTDFHRPHDIATRRKHSFQFQAGSA